MSNIIDKIQLSGVTYDLPSGGGGNTTVELTQAEYDALVSGGTVDPDTYYIITDATPQDMSQYWTSAQTNSAITQAVSGKASQSDLETVSGQVANKQDTLVSGTNIKTINNESILGSGNIDIQGGGGKAVSGGTNISITTGETADTINCTLPIVMKGSNMRINSNREFGDNLSNCFTFGSFNNIGGGSSCSYLVTFGSDNDMSASGPERRYRYSFGNSLKTQNQGEIAFSQNNNSVSASTTFGDSGNTLFSVGNGTSSSARHNAFEIRQNGDIYITKDGQDVKLQDQLGGGGSITVDDMLSSTSTNPVQNKVVKSATDRICKIWGYGTSGQTDIFSWATGSTSQYIDGYISFAKINNTRIVGRNNSPVSNFSLVETSAITTNITSSSTDSEVPSAKAVYDALQEGGGGGGSITIDPSLDNGSTNPVANSAITNVLSNYYYARKINNSVYSSPYGTISSNGCIGFTLQFCNIANPNLSVNSPVWLSKINGKKIFYSEYSTPNANTFNLSLVETSAITTNITSSSTDSEVPSAKAVNDKLGGLSLVKLTQAEYDALVTKDSNTLYIVTDS